jgi:hypothetical protein
MYCITTRNQDGQIVGNLGIAIFLRPSEIGNLVSLGFPVNIFSLGLPGLPG